MFTIDEAREVLTRADVFFGAEDDDPPRLNQTLNMNDTFSWAEAFGQYVPDEELPRVAQLFWSYGYGGLLFWVSEQNDGLRSEFEDVQRHIAFVREEERIVAAVPDNNRRAYYKHQYQIG
jgi:hypothetical protein